MRPLLTLILASLVLLGMIGFVLFLAWADRSRVQRLIESQGGRVERMTPREGPIWVRILTPNAVTHWDVDYTSRQGQPRRARCTAMMLRCVIDADEPATAAPGPTNSPAGERPKLP